MSLNSLSYILFLPLVVVVNFLIPKKYRYIWLFVASYVFYLSNDVRFLSGMAFTTLLTYGTAILLEKLDKNKGKLVLAACIIINICVLLVFRYSKDVSLIVPIGISFYALQAMGYAVDVYRKDIRAEKNIMKYALFVSFFPTVLLGPIQRSKLLLPQIGEGRDFDEKKAHTGLYYLLWGFLLKLVMANSLTTMVAYAYNDYTTLPGATLMWATILYAMELYCDFAGYSALAIGSAKLLGFDIGENFRQPYFSTSVKEFWRRWHISLSSYLKDYVYIPLGGNRKGKVRTKLNLLLTFTVSGLWHGAGLNFLVWGVLHGIYQVIGSLLPKKKTKQNIFIRFIKIGITFLLVDFAWLFFRAASLTEAVEILKRIILHFNLKEMTYYGTYCLGGSFPQLCIVLLGIVLVVLVDFLHEKGISIEKFMSEKVPAVIRWFIYVILTALIVFVVVKNYGQAASTFIYARF